MRRYLLLSASFLILVSAALGSVGGAGISDTSNPWSQQDYSAGTDAARIQAAEASALAAQQQSTQQQFYQDSFAAGTYPSGDVISGQAPQIRGPLEEQLTAETLGLSLPPMDDFTPDGSLDFTSVPSPNEAAESALNYEPVAFQGMDRSGSAYAVQPRAVSPLQSTRQTTERTTATWYYPSSLASSNRFYVQTSSGLYSVGGCGYGGCLPLWADIRASGNFFVYEWYPGQSRPYVHSLGWMGKGWMKGWFGGDVPGWHILCYNSGLWSNYIYIYVYPAHGSSGYSQPYGQPVGAYESLSAAYPAGLTPPNPTGEGLDMPDFNLYPPTSPASAATFTSETLVTGGVVGSSPYGAPLTDPSSSPGNAPTGYMAGGCNAVYPHPSVCKCNEYYVPGCSGKLDTVAGVFCGEWLPLWSKISRPGDYWSFEWKTSGGKGGSFCSPDVRNFGYKGKGWHQTWFEGDDLGWHILSYYSNDWSNYIYIYVWPDQ